MVCPFCKITIDDDSFYCDQCGQEILVCPKCNVPRKGKMCTSDGTALVTVKTRASAIVNTCELRLINKNLGLDLKIEDGDVIGRENGRFANLFVKYQQISGYHAQFKYDNNKGWMVTDVGTNHTGSTNGTFYNNVRLKPLQPEVISNGAFLRFANIEFYVEIQGQAGKTTRI